MNKKIILSTIVFVGIFVVAGVAWRQMRPMPKYSGPIEKFVLADDGSELNMIAREKGFFKENGLDPQFKTFTAGLFAVNSLLEGEADLATATDFVGANKIFSNKNLRILTQLSAYRGLSLIGIKDRGINKPSDIKGKTVGLAKNTIGEYFFEQFLIANDISRKEVTIVYLSIPEIESRIEKGEIDAAVIWDPYIYNIKKKLGDSVISWAIQNSHGVFVVSYSTDEFIKAHPGIIERYVRSLIQTEQYIKENPVEAKEISAKNFHYDNEYVQYIFTIYNFGVRLEQSLLLELEGEARFLIANKTTDQTEVPNYLDFIYFDALEKVKPEAVTIIR